MVPNTLRSRQPSNSVVPCVFTAALHIYTHILTFGVGYIVAMHHKMLSGKRQQLFSVILSDDAPNIPVVNFLFCPVNGISL